MKRPSIALVSLAAMMLAALPACGASTPPSPSPSPSPESGVRGIAKAAGGPSVDGTTNVWPSSNVTVVAHRGAFDGPVVAQAVADHNGRFRIDLPPGTYTLVQAEVAGQPKTVVVHAGEYVRITLWQAIP
jgi:multidrug efflux pump subunit AcrA (membrane-fusion protein)